MKRLLKILELGLRWRFERFLGCPMPGALLNGAMNILRFIYFHGKIPNLKMPRTFSEHLLKLKVSPEISDVLRQFVTDKEYLKAFVKITVGDVYNVPTHAVLKSPEEFSKYSLPAQCVIKPTHMSGQVMFRRNASDAVDYTRIAGWFRQNFFDYSREYNYKYLKPKIIVEEILDFFNTGEVPQDYKIFCFRGIPKFIQVDLDRFGDHRRCFFTTNWEYLPFSILHPRTTPISRPENLGQMLQVAAALAKDFASIRVDLYTDGRRCLVGELTNCHGSADELFDPVEADLIIGRLFDDPNIDLAKAFADIQGKRPQSLSDGC